MSGQGNRGTGHQRGGQGGQRGRGSPGQGRGSQGQGRGGSRPASANRGNARGRSRGPNPGQRGASQRGQPGRGGGRGDGGNRGGDRGRGGPRGRPGSARGGRGESRGRGGDFGPRGRGDSRGRGASEGRGGNFGARGGRGDSRGRGKTRGRGGHFGGPRGRGDSRGRGGDFGQRGRGDNRGRGGDFGQRGRGDSRGRGVYNEGRGRGNSRGRGEQAHGRGGLGDGRGRAHLGSRGLGYRGRGYAGDRGRPGNERGIPLGSFRPVPNYNSRPASSTPGKYRVQEKKQHSTAQRRNTAAGEQPTSNSPNKVSKRSRENEMKGGVKYYKRVKHVSVPYVHHTQTVHHIQHLPPPPVPVIQQPGVSVRDLAEALAMMQEITQQMVIPQFHQESNSSSIIPDSSEGHSIQHSQDANRNLRSEASNVEKRGRKKKKKTQQPKEEEEAEDDTSPDSHEKGRNNSTKSSRKSPNPHAKQKQPPLGGGKIPSQEDKKHVRETVDADGEATSQETTVETFSVPVMSQTVQAAEVPQINTTDDGLVTEDKDDLTEHQDEEEDAYEDDGEVYDCEEEDDDEQYYPMDQYDENGGEYDDEHEEQCHDNEGECDETTEDYDETVEAYDEYEEEYDDETADYDEEYCDEDIDDYDEEYEVEAEEEEYYSESTDSDSESEESDTDISCSDNDDEPEVLADPETSPDTKQEASVNDRDQNSGTALPSLCRNHNTKDGCKTGTDCRYLHVCRFFLLYDKCNFGKNCKKGHDLYARQSKAILVKHGIDVSKPQERLIEEYRKKSAEGSRAKGQKTTGSDHNSEHVVKDICIYFLRGSCDFDDRCHNYHCDYPYQWQIKCNGKNQWLDVDEDTNEDMERHYADPNQVEFSTTLDNDKPKKISLHANFARMSMLYAGEPGLIRRLTTSSVKNSAAKQTTNTKWIWYRQNTTDGKWTNFEDSEEGEGSTLTFELNERFESKETHQMEYIHGGKTYFVDLKDMKLLNKKDKSMQSIVRRPRFVSCEDFDNMMENLKNKRMESENKETKGDNEGSETNFPGHWEPDTGECALVEIEDDEETEVEFRKIEKLFRASIPESEYYIHRLYRIQNIELWDRYARNKAWKKKKTGQDQEEKLLFHGTKKEHVDGICQQGFDWRHAGSSVGTRFGKGSYFASAAKFAKDYSNGRHLLVARVLVGKSTKGDPEYVKPPANYDSCVDSVNNPRMYVVFEQERAYPEYLIRFKKEKNPLTVS